MVIGSLGSDVGVGKRVLVGVGEGVLLGTSVEVGGAVVSTIAATSKSASLVMVTSVGTGDAVGVVLSLSPGAKL